MPRRRAPYRGTPTTYSGVTFRSHLEAAWANRFDALGVAWAYEPVRVRLLTSGDHYTPDFGLAAYRAWVEVKPRDPWEADFDRAAEAAGRLGGGVYFLCGTPRLANYWMSRNTGGGWYFVPATAADLPFPTEFPGAARGTCGGEYPCNPCGGPVMSWELTATKSNPGGGGGFEKPPPGNHPARLVAIVDMGEQWQDGYQGAEGKYQHRMFFVWELVTKKMSGSSRNHVIGIDLTYSLNEKAKLRAWIGSQRGRPIADGEGFKLESWLGHACLLNVVEKNGYPKVEGVSGVPDGFTVPDATYKPFGWEIAEAAKTGRIDLPTWLPYFYGRPIGDAVKAAQELVGRDVVVVNSPNEPPAGGGAPQSAPAAGGPPPRRGSAAPAEPQFYLGADGVDEKVLRKVPEIRALAESQTNVDWSKAEVCKDGGQDWTPLPVAIPEFATWKVTPF